MNKKGFHTFSTTPSHLIPAHPLVTVSHTSLPGVSYCWQPLSWHPHFIRPFQLNFLTSPLLSSGYSPSSAPTTVLLVVFEHSINSTLFGLLPSGPRLTRNLPNGISIFFYRTELNLHLIGQEMNHQAGILRILTKNQIQQRRKKDFLGRI